MKNSILITALRRAFSLVELMISLITISVIVAAMTPVITKKLSSQRIAVGSFGGGGGTVTNLICCNDSTNYSYNPTNSKCEKTNSSGDVIDTQDPIACAGQQFSFECSGIDPNCFACTPDKTTCQICVGGYDLEGNTCKSRINCADKFGTTDCTACNETVCTSCLKTCEPNQYLDQDACKCVNCTEYGSKCVECIKGSCRACESGYEIETNGTGCKVTGGVYERKQSGTTTFILPEGTTEVEAILVSGGASGGGGTSSVTKTWSFVTTGNAGFSNTELNKPENTIYRDASGIHTWTIPDELKGKTVKVSACGGGGGGSLYATICYQAGVPSEFVYGGDGGAIKDVDFVMPNWDASQPLKIHIGGAGGGLKGIYYNDNNYNYTPVYEGSLGGRMGGDNTAANNVSNEWPYYNWGAGSPYSYLVTNSSSVLKDAMGGYDPIYKKHGQDGGKSGIGGYVDDGCNYPKWDYNRSGGTGSRVGGGGGSILHLQTEWDPDNTCNYSVCWMPTALGGGGGAATLFYHQEWAQTASLIAAGGGGGGGCWGQTWEGMNGNGCLMFAAGGGGGGGENKAGNGAYADHSGYGLVNATAGKDSTLSIFGSDYCKGGFGQITPYYGGYTYTLTEAKPGAMRISYTGGAQGASGGGAGQIAVTGVISIPANANEAARTVTINVGAGGTSADPGTNGKTGGATSISFNGKTYSTQGGLTGGNTDGTTVGIKGYITNGQNMTQISPAGYSNTDGAQASGTTGGAGGATIIDGQVLCEAGGGGPEGSAGTSISTSFGGCGGGGGGSGAAGGAGAMGYVKIIYR